ncbi:hypothetical protein [Pedobacter sp.]|uniref:hypothetical protein n=1 Tax=Pedobacter sp. TaxID=1411316 RepID=UPI00396C8552
MKKIVFLALITLIVVSCKDKTSINADEAGKEVTKYLQSNPEYKTGKVSLGELKFNSEKEYKELEAYQKLEQEGYINLTRVNAKKKFLSKDSSFVYMVKLTDKASAFVLKQQKDNATVKAVNYELSDEKPVDFSVVNSSNAKITVTLKKVNTPFFFFEKNPDDSADFINKTYRLKYKKETGWSVTR